MILFCLQIDLMNHFVFSEFTVIFRLFMIIWLQFYNFPSFIFYVQLLLFLSLAPIIVRVPVVYCFLCKCRKKAPKEPSLTYPRRSCKKGYILIEVSTHMEYLFPGFFSLSNNINVTLFIFAVVRMPRLYSKKHIGFHSVIEGNVMQQNYALNVS